MPRASFPASPLLLEQLYRAHRSRAVRLARRILRDGGEAEDVVQEVFARLLLAPPHFEGRASQSTWLHRVVLNRSLSALRARDRRGTLRLEPAAPSTPEEQCAAYERARRFLAAWHTLSPRHRDLVWLRDVDGLDYGEIATRLGLRTGTVKSGLSRARERLHRALAAAEGAG